MNLENHGQALTDLVDYQIGSVVSRPLLRNTAGSVTLFAFDQHQVLSEHTTPHDALAISLEGELDITIAGDRHRLSRGEVLIMPANKPHEVHASTQSKMLLVMIRE